MGEVSAVVKGESKVSTSTFSSIKRRLAVVYRDVVINKIASSSIMPRRIRYAIYRAYGIDTKARTIFPYVIFGGPNIKIGKGSFINYRSYFDNTERIEIGDNCDVGMETMFLTSTHEIGSREKRAGTAGGAPIYIKDGCWVGARAMIMPGVTVGEGCIIASGAVVTKDCEPNGLYAGVPAKRIKDLP